MFIASTYEYKGFFSSPAKDFEKNVYAGNVEGVEEQLAYEGETYEQAEENFKKVIDDYLENAPLWKFTTTATSNEGNFTFSHHAGETDPFTLVYMTIDANSHPVKHELKMNRQEWEDFSSLICNMSKSVGRSFNSEFQS